jgi:hypothetical protein
MIARRTSAATFIILAAAFSGCAVTTKPVDEPDDNRQRGALLVRDKESADFAIDPTGTWLVKSSGWDGAKSQGLQLRRLHGKSFRPLLTGNDHPLGSGAQWMDSKQLAFVDPGKSRDSKRASLWVAGLNGTAREVPNAVVGGEDWEAWTVRDIVGATPDRIYFEAGKVIGSGWDLVSIRPDGSDRTVIANLNDRKPAQFDLALSPDGKRAVWTQETSAKDLDNRNDVVVGAPDGSDAVVLGRGHEPAWSPDGESIVYLGNAGRKEEDGLPLLSIYTVPANGSAKPRIQPSGYCCWAGRVQWIGKNTIVLSDAAYVVGDGRLYTVTLK